VRENNLAMERGDARPREDHQNDLGADTESSQSDDERKLPKLQTVALLMLIVCQCMAVRIMSLPLNRLIESRYCYNYYRSNDPSVIGPGNGIPEELCKLNSIQRKLALLQGSIETLHVLCGG
jgi:hypothetical protein